MKLKSGKELSQLEIIKRLNTMGIKYNSDIIGKNYYVNLYNDAIQSYSNKMKIKKELEKDKMYTDFYNQKLKKVKECSLGIYNDKNYYNKNNANNNNMFSDKNIWKKRFFSDFDDSLIQKIFITQIAYDFVDVNSEYIDKVGNAIPNILIPIQAIKKYTLLNIYPEILKKINEIIDILNDLIVDKFVFVLIILFLLLLIIIFVFFKRMKDKNRN